MATIYKDKIDLFYGGKSLDPRLQNYQTFVASSHIDIWKRPKALIPFSAFKSDQVKVDNITAFIYANSHWYGLGDKSNVSALPKWWYKASDPINDAWTAAGSGESSSGGTRNTKAVAYFHKYLYSLSGGANINAYGDITDVSPSFTDTALSITYSDACKGIITSDDLYLQPYDNIIARKNGAGSGPTNAWTAAALTLPSNLKITDIVEYGDSVAVAAVPLDGNSNSKVFIWDKVSLDPSDVIDWGPGQLQILDVIETDLIGISQLGGSGVNSNALFPRMTVRAWSGGKARIAFEVYADNNTFQVYGNHTKVRDGNRIVFGIQITIDGVAYLQLAAVGRKDSSYPLAFTLAQKINNDTTITGIQGVGKLGDYYFAAFNADGSVNRTNPDSFSSASGIYISQRITGEHSTRYGHDIPRRLKQLMMAGILCEALPTGCSISLYMRKDEETSWKLVRTYSTTSGVGFEAGTLDAATYTTPGTAEFGTCYEFQFKLVIQGATVADGTPTPVAIIFAFQDVGTRDLLGSDI